MFEFAHFLGSYASGTAKPVAFLAPMSGVSDLGMRRLAERFGAGFVVSEMVDSDYYLAGDPAASTKAQGQGIACHIVQIAGCRAETLADAARRAEAEGAAVVDINMGCPAKKVVGGMGGSALMRDLDHATRLVRAVTAAVGVPVTLKMRLGWDNQAINAPDLARRAEAHGVRMVSVHGRTRCQFYKGAADWAAIRAVKQSVSIPVVANGDCTSPSDALAMLAASGADGIMIGRAAVGRPWLVGEIAAALGGPPAPAATPLAKGDAACDHYATLLSLFGRARGMRHARKHLAGYALHAGHMPSSPLHRALVTSSEPDRVFAILGTMFETPPMEMAA